MVGVTVSLCLGNMAGPVLKKYTKRRTKNESFVFMFTVTVDKSHHVCEQKKGERSSHHKRRQQRENQTLSREERSYC